MQGRTIAGIIGFVVVGGGIFIFVDNDTEEDFEWGLHIVIFDVGQADAIVMVEPDGKAVIIDAGKNATSAGKIAAFLGDELENGVGVCGFVTVHA